MQSLTGYLQAFNQKKQLSRDLKHIYPTHRPVASRFIDPSPAYDGHVDGGHFDNSHQGQGEGNRRDLAAAIKSCEELVNTLSS